jgi:hypothetical protein
LWSIPVTVSAMRRNHQGNVASFPAGLLPTVLILISLLALLFHCGT